MYSNTSAKDRHAQGLRNFVSKPKMAADQCMENDLMMHDGLADITQGQNEKTRSCNLRLCGPRIISANLGCCYFCIEQSLGIVISLLHCQLQFRETSISSPSNSNVQPNKISSGSQSRICWAMRILLPAQPKSAAADLDIYEAMRIQSHNRIVRCLNN